MKTSSSMKLDVTMDSKEHTCFSMRNLELWEGSKEWWLSM